MRRIVITLLVLFVVSLVALLAAASLWQAPNEAATPSGQVRNQAFFVTMPDGVQLAVDVWLPPQLASGERVPAVLEGTRYWRDTGLSAFGRVAAMFGMQLPGLLPGQYASYFNDKGYAMVTVDVRGTGASFGVHDIEYSLQEVADYATVIDWIVEQTWSSGDVFAIGVSYGGTSAELMTTTKHPALKAVAPLYSDFDTQMHLATPGGVMQPAFIEQWSALVDAMDRNDLCGVIAASTGRDVPWTECLLSKLLVSGVKPVPGQWSALSDAVAQHATPNVAEMVRGLEYRDSHWADSGTTSADSQVFGRKAEIEASGIPMFVVTGWLDAATSDGALARFASFSNPQDVWIGPFNHGGGNDVDPFNPADTPSIWSQVEQLDRVEAFFRRHINADPTVGKTLNYFVMGSGRWRETDVWPPGHLNDVYFFFEAEKRLESSAPKQTSYDSYQVDFNTGTSSETRWITQLGARDVIYESNADAKGLSFTSAPLEQDMEITGAPVLDIWMTSTSQDGAMHSYLEAIAPNGNIIYLTEGVLGLKHRRNTSQPPYPTFAPAHSFLEQDAIAMPTGKIERITTALYATSVKIPQGYRIRIRLTGADTTSFAPIPEPSAQPPRWHIYHGPTKPSSLTLPMAPWAEQPAASATSG